MSLRSRRPSGSPRVVVAALALLALVLGLLAGPASAGGAQAVTRAVTQRAAAPAEREDAVVETLGWLQRRTGHSHLVRGPARHERVKVRRAHGKRAHWVSRSRPGRVYPGASIDVALALRRLDPGSSTPDAIVRALQRSADRYVSYRTGALRGRYAGATARLVHLAATAGIPLGKYADGSLRRSLAAMVRDSPRDPQRGRVVDSGWGGDTSDTISQAAAVQALAAVDSKNLRIASRFLAKQACPAGHFRAFMDSPDYTCKGSIEARNRASSVEATALAILALRSARSHGVRRLGDEIADASHWLARQVGPSGGVAEDEGLPVDARSTALAAVALKATGRLGPAGNAAAWLLRHQVDATMIKHHRALRGQRGAIAWSRRALVRAQRQGITRGERTQWLRSTASAAPGLSALLPAKHLTVTADRRKRRLVVHVRGLVVGERYVLTRNGRVVSSGLAEAHGVVRVVLRKARGDVRLTAAGNRKGRSGVKVVSGR